MRPSPIAQTGTMTAAAMMAELMPAGSEDEPPPLFPRAEGVAVAVVDEAEAEAAGVAVPVALAVDANRCESVQSFVYRKGACMTRSASSHSVDLSLESKIKRRGEKKESSSRTSCYSSQTRLHSKSTVGVKHANCTRRLFGSNGRVAGRRDGRRDLVAEVRARVGAEAGVARYGAVVTATAGLSSHDGGEDVFGAGGKVVVARDGVDVILRGDDRRGGGGPAAGVG